ncbi:FtsX-like permease family protein [Streptococcus panodentis]|uniref:ABC transporter permease n=1 Tax=Streptococcus panodentis TaxID=1581472 RepID=A0ABS5AYU4_9STRE|nr:FtsX-like permease family protein [Streptococcus panodentis]MBP2621431.1 ABC transporter permease [Streptococcus panodentis]
MFQRLIKNDFKSNKVSVLVITVFLLLTLTLCFAAVRLTVSLASSVDRFVERAKSPHLLQMHSGSINRERLQEFVRRHPQIESWQIADFVNVDGSEIRINGRDSLQDSSQDNGFSSQNQTFDFLLDKDNRPAQPQAGQVYIPLYYYSSGRIRLGDRLQIGSLQLTVQGYIRDAQMNAGLVSSKRFLIAPEDLDRLKQENAAAAEALIEFRVRKAGQISAIEEAYKTAGLESNGPPMISYPTIKMINSLNDALVILVMGLLALAVLFITFLCMRFALLTKIEEELEQIAVMKVMGLPQSFIKKVYLAKYTSIIALALAGGWTLSFLLTGPLKKETEIFMGKSPTPLYSYVLEAMTALLLCLLLVWLTSRPLSSFKKLTPSQALKLAAAGHSTQKQQTPSLGLPKHPLWDGPYFACQQIFSHKKLYLTMLLIISLISLLVLLPAALYSTVTDRHFIQYLGAGQADLLIDISQTEEIDAKTDQLLKELQADQEIAQVSDYRNQNFSYLDRKGQTHQLRISLGSHSLYPVKYSQGQSPKSEQEIALSKLNADELKLQTGDSLTLLVDGKEKKLTVTGIYSDLTYGGKTAKASFQTARPQTLTSLLAVSLKASRNKSQKIKELQKRYPEYKLTDVEDFFHQTFDGTLASLSLIQTGLFWTGSALVFILMTLFVYMIFTKDRSDLALCRMLGFSSGQLRSYYLLANAFVCLLALGLAYLLLLILGQPVCSLLLSGFGISRLSLVINPLLPFLLLPLTLLASALSASVISLRAMTRLQIGSCLKEQ